MVQINHMVFMDIGLNKIHNKKMCSNITEDGLMEMID